MQQPDGPDRIPIDVSAVARQDVLHCSFVLGLRDEPRTTMLCHSAPVIDAWQYPTSSNEHLADVAHTRYGYLIRSSTN
jgi:hypothetical protein